jgi:hypothetical protein
MVLVAGEGNAAVFVEDGLLGVPVNDGLAYILKAAFGVGAL